MIFCSLVMALSFGSPWRGLATPTSFAPATALVRAATDTVRQIKSKLLHLRGWAPRGQRIKAKVPHGHWKTMTFVAALRHDRIEAPWAARRADQWRVFPNLYRQG